MPSPVDKYVKQVREGNPDYSEAQVWATAWSIYCKHKNPGSEHCKKDPSEYLKGKNAAMDDLVVRVAVQSSVDSRLASRVAARHVHALNLGETFENEKWRIHRYAMSIKATDLENAGKRGKKVQVIALYSMGARQAIPWESVAMEFVMNAKRGASFERMKQVAEENKEALNLDLEIISERGVDVMPGGFAPIKMDGKYVRLEAGYKSFSIHDKVDTNNLPTCIPAIEGGQKSIPVFYRWVKDNAKEIEGMKFREILNQMKTLGIKYHDFCAMD